MKKVPIISIYVVVAILFFGSSIVQAADTQNKLNITISQNYSGFDRDNFGYKYVINITINRFGHMTYIEDYFTLDSGSNPKPVMSKIYYDGDITENNISLKILRPVSRSGNAYRMIRAAIMIDGKRIYEKWLRISSGAHLTYTVGPEDLVIRMGQNIDKREIRERTIKADLPTVYEFVIPELAIYNISVTGESNENAELKVELLKGVPIGEKRFPGPVYKYLDISSSTYKIKNITLRYKIENSWINSSNLSKTDMSIYRRNRTDDNWYGLRTNITNRDTNYTYYESETAELSQFAIAGLRKTIGVSVTNNTKNDNLDNVYDNKSINKSNGSYVNKNVSISNSTIYNKSVESIANITANTTDTMGTRTEISIVEYIKNVVNKIVKILGW